MGSGSLALGGLGSLGGAAGAGTEATTVIATSTETGSLGGPIGLAIGVGVGIALAIAIAWKAHTAAQEAADDKQKADQAAQAAKESTQAFPQTAVDSKSQCPNSPPGGNQPTSPEEEEIAKLGNFKGQSSSQIEQQLSAPGTGYSGPLTGDNGGKIFLKDLGNGRSVRVRLDPATVRNPPKGYADEVPHAHKEAVDTGPTPEDTASQDAANEIRYDDSGCPTTDKVAQHIPINSGDGE